VIPGENGPTCQVHIEGKYVMHAYTVFMVMIWCMPTHRGEVWSQMLQLFRVTIIYGCVPLAIVLFGREKQYTSGYCL